jgi:hypothetical protein
MGSTSQQKTGRAALLASLGVAACLVAHSGFAGPREQVKRIHDRIAGVPATDAFIDTWAPNVTGNPGAVAFEAMQNASFYSVTLKNMAMPWTNRDFNVFAELNDYVATYIGLVRDDEDFRKALYDDVVYVADPALGLPAYNPASNAHYAALEDQYGPDLKTALVRKRQSEVSGLPPAATAGLMTTRAAAKAFLIDGTNRANFRFTLLNHLCNDLEQVKDITLPADRIRQDISRSPGGDSRIYLNNCIGCHTGMDPLAQAFAYYDYVYDVDTDEEGNSGRIDYNQAGEVDPQTGSRVKAKYHINANNFKQGYITPNDGWTNYWRMGVNRRLGWDDSLPGSGSGAKSMGQELAHSTAFAQCQVTKVFRNVCLRPPANASDRTQVATMVGNFAASGYRLKQVFADAAVHCMGD